MELQSEYYDADVAVIGHGPAGLSAAIRARWVKGYSVLPSSVVVIGTGPIGGLLPLGGAILTGPGWAFKGKDLLKRLTNDVRRLSIPLYQGEVTRIKKEGPSLVVSGTGFLPQRVLSVVLATGLRTVGDEARHYQKGVYVTFKGYSYLPTLIAEAAADSHGHALLIVGNDQTELLLSLFEGVAERAGGLSFVVDAPAGWQPASEFPGTLIRGRLATVELERGPQSAPGRLFRVDISGPDGTVQQLRCGAILLDYNAFEHRPSPRNPYEAAENLLAETKRDSRGFVVIDPWMRTSIQGLFAAGDVTGRYSSTMMAIGDGICAGFGAYRWAYGLKFGGEPRLFAYAPSDEVIPRNPIDLPSLPDNSRPKLLCGAPRFREMTRDAGFTLNGNASLFDGSRTLRELSAELRCDLEQLRDSVLRACAARLMTVHLLHSESSFGNLLM